MKRTRTHTEKLDAPALRILAIQRERSSDPQRDYFHVTHADGITTTLLARRERSDHEIARIMRKEQDNV